MNTNAGTMNHGASIPDTEAIGPLHESLQQWRQREEINVDDQIKIVKLSHMRYQHPDLKEITTFLEDFGFVVAKATEEEVWYRGYGPDQYSYYARRGPKKFLGGCFEVEDYKALEMAAKFKGASEIQTLDAAPGRGSLVTLTDPEGVAMNLIFGQAPVELEQEPGPKKLVLNYERDKPRVRKFQRFKEGPAAVYKLGHYGLTVTDFERQSKWYTRHFNIVPTDFLYVPDQDGGKKIVAVFAHIDRGKDLVDHHTIFLSTAAKTHVHHCSFEVHDFDTQQLGHQWLADKGYKSVWGVGRHILGSQIFDYWWDTTGNMIEHYADGDLVNEDTPIGLLPAGDESLAVWGPEVPAAFLD